MVFLTCDCVPSRNEYLFTELTIFFSLSSTVWLSAWESPIGRPFFSRIFWCTMAVFFFQFSLHHLTLLTFAAKWKKRFQSLSCPCFLVSLLDKVSAYVSCYIMLILLFPSVVLFAHSSSQSDCNWNQLNTRRADLLPAYSSYPLLFCVCACYIRSFRHSASREGGLIGFAQSGSDWEDGNERADEKSHGE